MTRKPIYVGSKPKLTAEIRLNNVLTDPSALSLKVRAPDGTITIYSYPATITKASTGTFYIRIPITAAGVWSYRWIATGTAESAAAGSFEVIPDPVP